MWLARGAWLEYTNTHVAVDLKMWRLTGAGLGLAKSAGIHCRLLRLSQAVNLSPQSEEASNSATVTPAIFSERYKSVELIRKECRRVLARAEGTATTSPSCLATVRMF